MHDLQNRHHTAIHETGHAVAHFRLNIEQLSASITPEGQQLGRVLADSSVWNKQDAEDQVIAYCSGYAACTAADLAAADEGCEDDFEKAQEIIDSWLLGRLADWKTNAVQLMSRHENIRAVALIAKKLERWETLDADYMDVLLGQADGKMTEAEVEKYCDNRSGCDTHFAEKYRQFRE